MSSSNCNASEPSLSRIQSEYSPIRGTPPDVPSVPTLDRSIPPIIYPGLPGPRYQIDSFSLPSVRTVSGRLGRIYHSLPRKPTLTPIPIPRLESYTLPNASPSYIQEPRVTFSPFQPPQVTVPSLTISPFKPQLPPEVSLSITVQPIEVTIDEVPSILNRYTQNLNSYLSQLDSLINRGNSYGNLTVVPFNFISRMGYPSVLERRKESLISHMNSAYALYQRDVLAKSEIERRLLSLDVVTAKARIVHMINSEKVAVYLPYLDAIVKRVKAKFQAEVMKYRQQAIQNQVILMKNKAILERNNNIIRLYKAAVDWSKTQYEVNQARFRVWKSAMEVNEAAVSVYQSQVAVAERLEQINEINLRIYKDFVEGHLRGLAGISEAELQKVDISQIEVANAKIRASTQLDTAIQLELNALNDKIQADLDAYTTAKDALMEKGRIFQDNLSLLRSLDSAMYESLSAKITGIVAKAESRALESRSDAYRELINLELQLANAGIQMKNQVLSAKGSVEIANMLSEIKATTQAAQADYYNATVKEAENKAKATICIGVKEEVKK